MISFGAGFYKQYGTTLIPEVGKTRSTKCPICGIATDAQILYVYKTKGGGFINAPAHEMDIYQVLLRCTHCTNAFFIMQPLALKRDSYSSETLYSHCKTYPIYRSANLDPNFNEEIIPKAILEDYIEADLDYYSGAFRSAGLLLRSACQNICRDKECNGNNLKQEIKALKEKGLITSSLADMADCVRLVGNEIAHPKPSTPFEVTQDDVKEIQEFTRQLIDAIYIGPYKAAQFKKSIADRVGSNKTKL